MPHPVLSPSHHEQFLRDGYFVLEGFIPPDVVETTLRVLRTGPDAPPDFTNFEAPEVTEIMKLLHEPVEELFGKDYDFDRHGNACDMRRPHEPQAKPGFTGGHLDLEHAAIMPEAWGVWSWIFLTEVTPGGGALGLAAGSPYQFRALMLQGVRTPFVIYDTDGFDPDFVKTVGGGLPYQPKLEEFHAKPGDVLFYHHLMGHAGSTNITDPTTRHALQSFFTPYKRIVPGLKPFNEMSTIEKANSTRFLSEHMPDVHPRLAIAANQRTSEALAGGLTSGPGVIGAQLMRLAGRTHRFVLRDANPLELEHSWSADLLEWTDEAPVDLPGPARNFTLYQHPRQLVLAASLCDGDAALQITKDLVTWKALGTVPGADRGVAPYHLGFGGKTAKGNLVLHTSAAGAGRVTWTSTDCKAASPFVIFSEDWTDPAGWEAEGIAHEVKARTEVYDVAIETTIGSGMYALVTDLGDDEAVTSPWYSLSEDGQSFESKEAPLEYDAPTPPRRIRVYDRARNFWLVSYVRDHEGEARVFFGAIDWDVEPPVLKELNDVDRLQEAFAVVGLV